MTLLTFDDHRLLLHEEVSNTLAVVCPQTSEVAIVEPKGNPKRTAWALGAMGRGPNRWHVAGQTGQCVLTWQDAERSVVLHDFERGQQVTLALPGSVSRVLALGPRRFLLATDQADWYLLVVEESKPWLREVHISGEATFPQAVGYARGPSSVVAAVRPDLLATSRDTPLRTLNLPAALGAIGVGLPEWLEQPGQMVSVHQYPRPGSVPANLRAAAYLPQSRCLVNVLAGVLDDGHVAQDVEIVDLQRGTYRVLSSRQPVHHPAGWERSLYKQAPVEIMHVAELRDGRLLSCGVCLAFELPLCLPVVSLLIYLCFKEEHWARRTEGGVGEGGKGQESEMACRSSEEGKGETKKK